jgi:hypothetical protein
MKDWMRDKAYDVAAMIEASIVTDVMFDKGFECERFEEFCEQWGVTSDDFYTFLEAGKKHFMTTWLNRK